jgi:hypothetical protein
MKNIKLSILYTGSIYVVAIMILFGCKKNWFDVKSNKSLTVPSSLQDFQYLLDNYTLMNQNTLSLGEVGSDQHYPKSNIWTLKSSAFYYNERNASTWSHDFPYNAVKDWNLSYQKIFQCNLVLDGLNKMAKEGISDQSKFNNIKGNALFHRAKNYFDLAQIYAQPYISSTASQDLGIPLKDGIDVTQNSTRSTVKQTYDQIIADLKAAAALLPSLPELLTRGSKASAFALLSRTYLTMQDYSNAKIYADSTLAVDNKLMDFNDISVSDDPLGQFNKEVLFSSEMIPYFTITGIYGYSFVDSLLYSSYDSSDLRRSRFFRIVGSGKPVFKGSYTELGLLFSGLATDEIYLIRAECNARAGEVTAAMKDLNDLLKTRWDNTVSYVDVTASNADDALQKVLKEREKELLCRGLRWADLRRLNMDDRFRVTITRTFDNGTYTLTPNNYKYTLPIPNDEISLSGIKQNNGW